MHLQSHFESVIAAAQPEDTGHLPEGSYGAIGDRLTDWLKDKLISEAKRLVREQYDTPEERKQVADAVCDAVVKLLPQAAPVMPLLNTLLVEVLANVPSVLS